MIFLKKYYYTLFFLFFSISIFSQKEQHSLETHLKKIESHFGVNFNYESGLVKDRFCKTCYLDKKETLKFHTTCLEKEFRLKFTTVTADKIVIRKRKIDTLLLLDFDSKIPVQDVLISEAPSKKTWISDQHGSVNFEDNTSKKIALEHLNYGKQTIVLDSLKSNIIYLHKIEQNLEELFLTPYFTSGTYKSKKGNFYIKPKKIETLAGLTSHDVIKSLENLPQVISNSESTSDLIINGGTQDQNLFLWNDIKVYQNHHFFGLISAFNENLISKINLYDNATPAEYGNSTSGVISLEHDTEFSKKAKVGFGANFLSVDGYVKTPISKKMELQISARKSLTETWKSPTYLNYSKKIFQSSLVDAENTIQSNDITSNDEFRFNDIQMQYSYKPNANNIFNLNSIYLKNNLSYVEEDIYNKNSKKSELEQENWAFGLNWEHTFSNENRLQTSINYSQHTMDGGNFLLSKDIASKEHNSIENFETKLMYRSKASPAALGYTFGLSYDYLTTKNNTTNFNSLFISNLTQRSALYNAFGTLYYQSSKVYAKLDMRSTYYDFLQTFQIEPRFLFTYSLDPKLYIQFRGERKTQNILQVIDLENNFLGIEKRRWQMANNTTAPIQRSNQLEFSLNFKSKKSIFNVSAYTKKVKGITTNNQGFQNLNQFNNHFGEYNIHGIQGHYSFKSKYINAWISHSYSVNKYTFKNYPQLFFIIIMILPLVSFLGSI